MNKTRVVIVDDSALVRALLTQIINAQPDMQAVGAAANPLIAREMIRSLNPDVITLDVEMPQMDGIQFLERLMRLRPMPVVMVSSLTERGAEVTLRALELGAVDFVAKPKLDIRVGLMDHAADICDKIRAARNARVRRANPRTGEITRGGSQGVALPVSHRVSTEKVVFVGASTGGTEAIKELLMQLPADAPAIAITQHMPGGFTASFAKRLDLLTRLTVKEAEQDERLLPGHAYIAPGDSHFAVRKSGANYVAQLSDAPPVNRHRPSVEVLFLSAAQHVGRNAVGVMLTGMGKDGAIAMRAMRDAGAFTIAQDEASCVVYGMPREAVAQGGVDEILPLQAIGPRLLQHLAEQGADAVRV